MTLKELEKLITMASTIYYTGEWEGKHYDKPLMSDAQFDSYVRWLQSVCPTSPVLKKTGWGYNPNVVSGRKISHLHGGMDSISNKPRDIKDIPERLRNNVRISAKLDGLSGKMEFNNGVFVCGSTRGDGSKGIDKTDKFLELFKRYGNPEFPAEFCGEIRGEFVISKPNWDKMVASGTSKKNARNAAAGIINSDSITDEFQFIDFVPYKIIYDKNHTAPDTLLNEAGDCEFFCQYLSGFPKVPKVYKRTYTEQDLVDMHNGWSQLWPIDGVVIASNNVVVNEDGTRIHDEVAFKFESLKKQTVIESISWQQSKFNNFKPVANLKPVEIDGSTVSRVTLHNAANVIASELFPGAIIEVMKSGEVIPYVTQLISPAPAVTAEDVIPKVCPVCGHSLSRKGVDLCCTNPECENVDKQNLKIWCMTLGATDGVAETLLFQFLDRFNINCIDDIYKLPDDAFLGLGAEGVQARKFLQVMDKLRSQPCMLSDVLQALNISRFGEITCKKLASNNKFCDTLQEMINNRMISTNVDMWKNLLLPIVGEATTETFIQNMSKLRYLRYVASRIVFDDAENASELIPVCITGKLSVSRKDFETLLNSKGYVLKDDITKKTRFLITNESTGTSSKHKQAEKYGTQKVTEVEMLTILKNQGV